MLHKIIDGKYFENFQKNVYDEVYFSKIVGLQFTHNLGQKIVEKFMELSIIGFYKECFTTDF